MFCSLSDSFQELLFQIMKGKQMNKGPVKIDANFSQKNSIFINKDAKTAALQTSNRLLKEELQRQMLIFEELSRDYQQNRSKMGSLETANNILEIEEVITRKEINKLKEYYLSVEPTLNLKQQQVDQLENQVNLLRQELQMEITKDQEKKNLVKRYREEIKMEKTMAKSEKNLNSICQSLRKNHQNYIKNVDILKGKLQSKKKYLGILTKKLQKRQKVESGAKENASNRKKEMKGYSSVTRINFKQPNHEDHFEQQQSKQKVSKPSLKSYNDLIRKKNAILAQKK